MLERKSEVVKDEEDKFVYGKLKLLLHFFYNLHRFCNFAGYVKWYIPHLKIWLV